DVLEFIRIQPHRPQRAPARLLPRHRGEVGPHQQPVRAQHVDEVPDGAPVEHQRVVPEPAGQLGPPHRSGPRLRLPRPPPGRRARGGPSSRVRPQTLWARVSGSGTPPAAGLNARRSDGSFPPPPPVTIAAAASDPSIPTPNVATAGPGNRSEGAGIA